MPGASHDAKTWKLTHPRTIPTLTFYQQEYNGLHHFPLGERPRSCDPLLTRSTAPLESRSPPITELWPHFNDPLPGVRVSISLNVIEQIITLSSSYDACSILFAKATIEQD